MRRRFGAVTVECVGGDIAAQDDVEAVVNAANARLEPGGGVAGAIHRAAGPGLAEEARPLGPIRPGEAVITGAYGLPNRYVSTPWDPSTGRTAPRRSSWPAATATPWRWPRRTALSPSPFPPSRPASSATRSRRRRGWHCGRCGRRGSNGCVSYGSCSSGREISKSTRGFSPGWRRVVYQAREEGCAFGFLRRPLAAGPAPRAFPGPRPPTRAAAFGAWGRSPRRRFVG
jgi:Macro domain